MEDYGLEEFLRERDARYCAKCKKFTEKGILYVKFLGKMEYCKICHHETKKGEIFGHVDLRCGTTFKNDIARHLLNEYHTPIEYFSVRDIIEYLEKGIMQLDELPPEVAKGVRDEMQRTAKFYKKPTDRENYK